MYNEQLENLIEMALMDGELTEKEKQILFKKANEFGIDLDEFEMVLNARLFAKNKADAPPVPLQASPQVTSQTNKHGDINKCPACGSPVSSMTSSCADCGHDFSNIAAVSSAQKLHDELQAADKEERNREKPSAGGITGLIAGNIQDDDQMEDRIMTRKAGIISSYPIPNSKEDILEFLSMAVPEAGKKPNWIMRMSAKGTLYKAWVSKAEQIIMKARFSMKDDKSTLNEINSYAKALGIK